MPSLHELSFGFLDTLAAHLGLVAYLLAVTDERAVWRRLKKLPPLLLSPLTAMLLLIGLYTVPELLNYQYFIRSFAIFFMCTLWVRWVWQFSFWQAFAATCMAGIFQVGLATLSAVLLWDEGFQIAVSIGLQLALSIAIALLLYKLRFGKYFRLLLDNQTASWQTALLLFALETSTELFLRLGRGIQPQYLSFYYLLVTVMIVLMAVLVVYMAQRFDTAQKIQAQRDIITQQLLYEQDLENIRREVRAFRHDYKNLLAGLSEQADKGQLDQLRASLSELDAGFDRRIGEKIQASTQLGNVRVPQVRSLMLSKLTTMGEKGIDCRLEVLYPVETVGMDSWDFARCLGILLDNAAEAALEVEPPWMEVVLLAHGKGLSLRVSNPFAGTIDPDKIWKEGFSTKGEGRGLGLPSYQRILAGYANAALFTSWEGGVFVQELTVEGKP